MTRACLAVCYRRVRDEARRLCDRPPSARLDAAVDRDVPRGRIRRGPRAERGVSEISAPRRATIRVRGRGYKAVLTPDPEAGGYTVEVPELPGRVTEGDDLADAKRMAKGAIDARPDSVPRAVAGPGEVLATAAA